MNEPVPPPFQPREKMALTIAVVMVGTIAFIVCVAAMVAACFVLSSFLN